MGQLTALMNKLKSGTVALPWPYTKHFVDINLQVYSLCMALCCSSCPPSCSATVSVGTRTLI